MTPGILAHASVASNIHLLSAWIEAQMAYRGQAGGIDRHSLRPGISMDKGLRLCKQCTEDGSDTTYALPDRLDYEVVHQ